MLISRQLHVSRWQFGICSRRQAPLAMSSPSTLSSSDPTDAASTRLRRNQSKPEWKLAVSRHAGSDFKRSIWQLVNTLTPLIASVDCDGIYTVRTNYWLTLLLAIPAALLVVRSFIIFHDCGHGSFFKSQKRQFDHCRQSSRCAVVHSRTMTGAGSMPCTMPNRVISTIAVSATSGR